LGIEGFSKAVTPSATSGLRFLKKIAPRSKNRYLGQKKEGFMVKIVSTSQNNEFLAAYRRRLDGGGGGAAPKRHLAAHGGGAQGINFFHPAAHFGGHYLAVYQVDNQFMAIHDVDCFDMGTPTAALVDQAFLDELASETHNLPLGTDQHLDGWIKVFLSNGILYSEDFRV
jgi:hypothetical protein